MDNLDYDPVLIIKEKKGENIKISIYNTNNKEIKHIIDISKDSELYFLDSNTIMITEDLDIRLIDIQGKEIIQRISIEGDNTRKEREEKGEEEEGSDNEDNRKIISISFSSSSFPGEDIIQHRQNLWRIGNQVNNRQSYHGSEKTIKYIFLVIGARDENSMGKLYEYKNRNLSSVDFKLRIFKPIPYEDNISPFFIGDKYIINYKDLDEKEYPIKASFSIWDIQNSDKPLATLKFNQKNIIIMPAPNNTIMVRYFENNKLYFTEIDPIKYEIIRNIIIESGNESDDNKEYIITRDERNNKEYNIFFTIRNLYVFRTLENRLYIVEYLNKKPRIRKNLSSRNSKNIGDIRFFKVLNNNTLFIFVTEKDRNKDKYYETIFNIDTGKFAVFEAQITSPTILDDIFIISKNKFLYSDRIIDINTGEVRSRLGGLPFSGLLPFLLDEQKDKIKKKVIKLLKNNLIPIDIKRIIANFI